MRPLVLLIVGLAAGCVVVPGNRPRGYGQVQVQGTATVRGAPPAYDAAPQPVAVGGTQPAYTPAPQPPGLASKPVATGENHVCVLKSGDVHCWGSNLKGTLGLGTNAEPASGVVRGIGSDAHDVIQIVAGDYHTCALTASRAMWCWGSNHVAQLGQGSATETPINTPQPIRESGIRSIYAGPKSTCLQKDDGAVLCWGQNTVGAIRPGKEPVLSPTRVLALDGADHIAIGDYAICALRAGRVSCTGWLAEINQQLAALPPVTSLTAGWGHGCVVAAGKVICWGRNFQGALGHGDPCADQPTKEARSACLIKEADVTYPPRSVPGITDPIVQVADTCALAASGKVICWGGRGQNILARGLQEPYRTAHTLEGIDQVTALYAGDTFYCFLRTSQLICRGQPWSNAVSATIAR